eukprot:scaffold510_cov242-Pinguiococcus_pyrenoidosus.AAC.11
MRLSLTDSVGRGYQMEHEWYLSDFPKFVLWALWVFSAFCVLHFAFCILPGVICTLLSLRVNRLVRLRFHTTTLEAKEANEAKNVNEAVAAQEGNVGNVAKAAKEAKHNGNQKSQPRTDALLCLGMVAFLRGTLRRRCGIHGAGEIPHRRRRWTGAPTM